jgi:hypothetical protein
VSKSQNGWPVVAKSACDLEPLIRNVVVPNGVLAGDVAVVFRWLAGRYDATVERLVPGTCWGWFVKTIEGGDSISNHASATAIDLNADQHPMGVMTKSTFSDAQIKACHAIVTAAGGVLRWGGDYAGRPDSMHWEINASAAAVKAFAAKLRKQDDVTDDDIDKIADAVIAKMKTDLTYTPQGTTTPRKTVADVGLMETRRAKMQSDLEDKIAALSEKVDGLTPPPAA